MKRFKRRIWDKRVNKMKYQDDSINFKLNGDVIELSNHGESEENINEHIVSMQSIGLEDENEKDIFESDIFQFENGDAGFVLFDRGQIAFDYIGEWECEDQMRDFYRIERAKVIGNIWENTTLISELEKKALMRELEENFIALTSNTCEETFEKIKERLGTIGFDLKFFPKYNNIKNSSTGNFIIYPIEGNLNYSESSGVNAWSEKRCMHVGFKRISAEDFLKWTKEIK